jgi:hypothetical protein
MLLELINLEKRVPSSFSPDPFDSIPPILLLALFVKIGVYDQSTNNCCQRGPPRDHYHRCDTKNDTREGCELMIVLPFRSPVRRAEEIKEEAGDVDTSVAQKIEYCD